MPLRPSVGKINTNPVTAIVLAIALNSMNYPISALENIPDLPTSTASTNPKAVELPRLPSDSVRTASERFNRAYLQSVKTRKAIAAYMQTHGEG